MSWEVEYTDQFEAWWDTLTEEQQDELDGRVRLLEEYGPSLGRPVVGEVLGSRLPHLKELRASKAGTLRVLFTFDPLRNAILLVGGDKTGQWNDWYRQAIPEAERLYDEHLDELRREGWLPPE